MHNNIMAAGSRDRPPMLATGRYAQWRSRFLRYIDTRPNGDALRKCILTGPYTPTMVTTPAVPATEDSPEVPAKTSVETVLNMTPENKAHYESEKEAIHLILTGIGDEIYSTSLCMSDISRIVGSQARGYNKLQETKAKDIAKPITPPSEALLRRQYPEQAHERNQDMQIIALIAKYFKKLYKPTNNNHRTTSRHQKQESEKGCSTSSNTIRQAADTDEEIDEQELEAHYSYMAKIQEVPNADSGTDAEPLEQVHYDTDNNVFANDLQHFEQSESIRNTCAVETGDSNVIPDSPDMCDNDIQNDQHDVECDDERVALANLKLDVDENKKIQKQLKKANATLTQELTECKSILAETSRTLGESNSIRDSCLVALKTKEEFDRKEIDELESEKADFSNIYDLLLEECVSKDVICSYLHSLSDLNAHTELQCLYLHKVKECECLAIKLSKQTESVNKEVHNKLLKSFAKLENHSISLELALQQCKEQMKNNSVCKENGSNVFRKEREQYHEIQDLKAQMQDKNIAISELKKLIEKCKGKSVETQFDKPSVVRQPNAQRIPKPSVLGKPTPFSNSPEMRSFQTKKLVNKTNVSDGLFKPVTQQNLPQKRNQAVRNTNVLNPGMNTNPHVSKSTGVNHTTSVSRPQLKCYQVKDKVVPNNSQVKLKKKEVEDHHRISSISKKTKSVTACNDSSNSRIMNVNAVCAECGKCVFNSNHDACVSRYLKDVNSRTKKPNVVPISASKPKRKEIKSVATPHKKTIASDTTIQKSKSYYQELYKNTNQEWKWWIAKRCPSGYKWTQKPLKTKKIWMPKIRKDDVSLNISPSIDIVSKITNVLKISNFIGSNLSNIPSSSNSLADCITHPIHYLIQGNVMIKRVYYIEGLNHNLFSVVQFYDANLEVAFRKSTCFVRDLQGNNLPTGNRGSDLYTISLQETTSSTPICFMAKASPTQAWLLHRRLSHLNFDYITLL
ncbi:hypothetical protein Tco_0902156, partial [Tanacetum coccineum]